MRECIGEKWRQGSMGRRGRVGTLAQQHHVGSPFPLNLITTEDIWPPAIDPLICYSPEYEKPICSRMWLLASSITMQLYTSDDPDLTDPLPPGFKEQVIRHTQGPGFKVTSAFPAKKTKGSQNDKDPCLWCWKQMHVTIDNAELGGPRVDCFTSRYHLTPVCHIFIPKSGLDALSTLHTLCQFPPPQSAPQHQRRSEEISQPIESALYSQAHGELLHMSKEGSCHCFSE